MSDRFEVIIREVKPPNPPQSDGGGELFVLILMLLGFVFGVASCG